MDEAKIEHLFTYHRPSEPAVELMQESREKMMSIAVDLTRRYGPSPDLTVAIRALHRASMQINYAIIVGDEKLNQEGVVDGREHTLSEDCWCQPRIEEVPGAAS